MLRTTLLFAALVSVFPRIPAGEPPRYMANPVMSCADVPAVDPTDDGPVTPMPALTHKADVTVTIQFVHQYGEGDDREDTDAWSPIEMQYICSAARRMQAVWSSREFYKRLTSQPKLYLDHGQSISTEELYRRLTAKPVVLRLSVAGNDDEYGISWPQGWTKLPHGYLDRVGTDGTATGRGTSLVEDLTDTLSHEYTHYTDSVTSGDGHVRDDPRYVSYGVGCMTENIAVPGDDCSFDPSDPADWISGKHWKFPQ